MSKVSDQLKTNELVEETHENLKLLCQSDVPAVKDLAILMLAISRQLVMTVDPSRLEYMDKYE